MSERSPRKYLQEGGRLGLRFALGAMPIAAALFVGGQAVHDHSEAQGAEAKSAHTTSYLRNGSTVTEVSFAQQRNVSALEAAKTAERNDLLTALGLALSGSLACYVLRPKD